MEVYNKRSADTVLWPVEPVLTLEIPKVELELLAIKGCNRNIDITNEYYKYKNKKYKDSIQIFTDGQTDATGSAVYIPKYEMGISKRSSDSINVYAVELCAVLIALEWIEQYRDISILACSDSVSALMSMKTGKARSHQEILYEIVFINSRVCRQGKTITYMWIPAHVGIQGNEEADRLGKTATKTAC